MNTKSTKKQPNPRKNPPIPFGGGRNRGVGDMLEDLGSDGTTWDNEENSGNKNKSETYERGGS